MALPYPLLLLLAAATAEAAPQSPLPVHAVVVSDPRDGSAGGLLAERVGWLLQTSGYVLLDRDVLEGRIAEPPESLHRRCAGDATCWREVGLLAGIEQVVLVDHISEQEAGIRVVDVGAQAGFRRDRTQLTGGYPDPGVVERMFGGHGSLRVSGLPVTAFVQIDGGDARSSPQGLRVDPMGTGKHSLEFTAEGYAPLFVTVMVYPGQTTDLPAVMLHADEPTQRRRPAAGWVGIGLVVGGIAALALGGGGDIAGEP